MSRSSRRFVTVLMALALVTVVVLLVVPRVTGSTGPESGLPITYEVLQGASVRAVGDDLEALGVIDSSRRFRTAAEDAGLVRTLQPGRFELVTGMDVEAAIAVLAAGPIDPLLAEGVRFTVPEGLTVADTLEAIDAAFDDVGLADLTAVLDERRQGPGDGRLVLPDWVPDPSSPRPGVVEPYEGLLWPETYEVAVGADARTILQTMIDQLEREMDAVAPDGVIADGGASVDRYELLAMASLVERETRVDSERALVAGVIANRLRDGMRLEIDATLSYAKGDLSAIPLAVDRDIDSPFNTYRNAGLPPGPISGVGRAALMAAARPEDTSAYFYVLDPACDGTHRFAAGFDEHQRNVAAFRAARDAGACEP